MNLTVEDVKKSLRVSHDALDDEIERNFQTCLRDLSRVGVDPAIDSPLIDKACDLYCKWQQDYQGKAEMYRGNYEQLRDSLSLSEEYRCTIR